MVDVLGQLCLCVFWGAGFLKMWLRWCFPEVSKIFHLNGFHQRISTKLIELLIHNSNALGLSDGGDSSESFNLFTISILLSVISEPFHLKFVFKNGKPVAWCVLLKHPKGVNLTKYCVSYTLTMTTYSIMQTTP